jgi:hypothetical protein
MKALAVLVIVVCATACETYPVDGRGAENGPVVDLSSPDQVIGDWVVEGRDPAPDPTSGGGGDGTDPPQVGCVTVQYCDAPGPDGTRCVQTGCSVQDALIACSREAPRQCLRIACPFVFVGPGGKRFKNGECF